MHLYKQLGDQIGTDMARDLARQLANWHDEMVRHVRVVGRRRAARCAEDCPHDEAVSLWSAAQDTFGGRASALEFLRLHGQP